MSIIGLKKTNDVVDNSHKIFELDELYWFIEKKRNTETRKNLYIITMIQREPRQIISYDVDKDRTSARIQKIVDGGPEAANYCTDGYSGYLDVIFPGEHIRNVHNKKDTFTVEDINADMRHFIPLLRRSSRCFPRTLATLRAVLDVFVEAYNRFGLAKYIPSSQPQSLSSFRFCRFPLRTLLYTPKETLLLTV